MQMDEEVRMLRKCKEQIMKATQTSETRKAAAAAEQLLHKMKSTDDAEAARVVGEALRDIARLFKYDTTRDRVCMKLQTVIMHFIHQ